MKVCNFEIDNCFITIKPTYCNYFLITVREGFHTIDCRSFQHNTDTPDKLYKICKNCEFNTLKNKEYEKE